MGGKDDALLSIFLSFGDRRGDGGDDAGTGWAMIRAGSIQYSILDWIAKYRLDRSWIDTGSIQAYVPHIVNLYERYLSYLELEPS